MHFIKQALGISRNIHDIADPNKIQKSISQSRTFRNIKEKKQFYEKINEIAENLESRIEKQGLMGRTITLEIKDIQYNLKSKGITLPDYICTKEDMIKACSSLLDDIWPCPPTRLIGISLSNT